MNVDRGVGDDVADVVDTAAGDGVVLVITKELFVTRTTAVTLIVMATGTMPFLVAFTWKSNELRVEPKVSARDGYLRDGICAAMIIIPFVTDTTAARQASLPCCWSGVESWRLQPTNHKLADPDTADKFFMKGAVKAKLVPSAQLKSLCIGVSSASVSGCLTLVQSID